MRHASPSSSLSSRRREHRAGRGPIGTGNGEAIAREIPGARLLVIEEAATAISDAATGVVAEAMLALRRGGECWPHKLKVRSPPARRADPLGVSVA
jgi:hypothetical protein